MNRLLFTIFLFTLTFLTFVSSTRASIYINEIYPAPVSPNSEWVELYNDGDTEVSLANYTIIDNSNVKLTFSVNTILAKGYITATSSSVLNNTGDTVTLKENTSTLESVTYPALNSTEAYVRCNNVWSTLSTSTRDLENANCPTPTPSPTLTIISTTIPTSTLTPVPTASPTTTQTPTPTPLPNYNNIYISEVMVAPETGLGEWVEIYNGNDFSVSLTNWYIDDIPDAGSSPRLFSIAIPAKSLVVLDLTSSLFNNSGDSVRILDQNKIEKDKIDYEYSEQGKTWGRTDPTNKSTHCLQTPSKGNNNNPCLVTEDSSVSSTTKATKSTQTTTKTSTSTSSTSKTSTSKNTPINYSSQLKRYSIAVTPPTINHLQIEKSNSDVLGVEIEVEKEPNYLLSKTLFFLSGSYSLLSLLSIGIKLKLYLG